MTCVCFFALLWGCITVAVKYSGLYLQITKDYIAKLQQDTKAELESQYQPTYKVDEIDDDDDADEFI